jgi:hypothetical protein
MKILNQAILEKFCDHEMPLLIHGMTEYGTKVEFTGIVNAYSIDTEKGFVKLWIGANSPLVLTEAFFFPAGQRFYTVEEEPAVEYGNDLDSAGMPPLIRNPEREALMKSWKAEVK